MVGEGVGLAVRVSRLGTPVAVGPEARTVAEGCGLAVRLASLVGLVPAGGGVALAEVVLDGSGVGVPAACSGTGCRQTIVATRAATPGQRCRPLRTGQR